MPKHDTKTAYTLKVRERHWFPFIQTDKVKLGRREIGFGRCDDSCERGCDNYPCWCRGTSARSGHGSRDPYRRREVIWRWVVSREVTPALTASHLHHPIRLSFQRIHQRWSNSGSEPLALGQNWTSVDPWSVPAVASGPWLSSRRVHQVRDRGGGGGGWPTWGHVLSDPPVVPQVTRLLLQSMPPRWRHRTL